MDAVTVTYLIDYKNDFRYPLGPLTHAGSLMALITLLRAFFLVLPSHCRPEAFEEHNLSDLLCTCNQIAKAVSGASQVFFPGECGIPPFVMLQSNG
jgi:hypothetical protein